MNSQRANELYELFAPDVDTEQLQALPREIVIRQVSELLADSEARGDALIPESADEITDAIISTL